MVHAGLPIAVIDSPVALASVPPALLALSGWLLDPVGPVDQAYILLDGRIAGTVSLGLERPDVGAVFPAVAHASRSGWEAALDLRAAKAVTATVSLLVATAPRQWTEIPLTTYTVDASLTPPK